MCASGGGAPAHTQIVVTSVNGPGTAASTANAVATCPSGTRLVGGGALTAPASQASNKPTGSYPSDAAGDREGVTDNPDSWAAVGGGGRPERLSSSTTALAVCSTDPSLQTTIVRASDIDHPAGPGNGNPGSDAIATVTATCTAGTTLLDGGALTTGDAAGDDGGNVQQGVHLRGSYPSDGSGAPRRPTVRPDRAYGPNDRNPVGRPGDARHGLVRLRALRAGRSVRRLVAGGRRLWLEVVTPAPAPARPRARARPPARARAAARARAPARPPGPAQARQRSQRRQARRPRRA